MSSEQREGACLEDDGFSTVTWDRNKVIEMIICSPKSGYL